VFRADPVQPNIVVQGAGFNSPIGIDESEALGKLIVSVHYSNGLPYNFELIGADGSRQQFSSISGLTEEIKIATAKQASAAKWAVGTFFTGNGVAGQVMKVSPDGNIVTNPFVTLPSGGLMRGSLFVDDTGVWGYRLIVCTTNGRIYAIDNDGSYELLYSAPGGVHLEGLVVLPNDTSRWGTFAGAILAGAEAQQNVHFVKSDMSNGVFRFLDPVSGAPIAVEDLDMIPQVPTNFFGVNYGQTRIIGVKGSEFAGIAGHLLVTMEHLNGNVGTGLWHVHLDLRTETFVVERITFSPALPLTQWEHVTFAKAGLGEVPPIVDCPERTLSASSSDGTATADGKCLCVRFA
jgi:hypothetical protein